MDAYLISLTVTKNVICEDNTECNTYHVPSCHPRLNLALMWKFKCVYLLSMHTNSRHYYSSILYYNIIYTVTYEKFMFCTFPFALKLKNTSAEFYYESRSKSSEVDNHLSGWKGPVFERKPPRVTREVIKIHPCNMEEVNVSLSWNFNPNYLRTSRGQEYAHVSFTSGFRDSFQCYHLATGSLALYVRPQWTWCTQFLKQYGNKTSHTLLFHCGPMASYFSGDHRSSKAKKRLRLFWIG